MKKAKKINKKASSSKREASKKAAKKTLDDYTGEELDAMDEDVVADLYAQAAVDNLNK
ncbi:MAG: hypothetical protein SGJ02_12755 [bacterium]|nr:hypothetical protein [bacterium]